MYKMILTTLDTTPTDRAIVDHILQLAKLMGSHVVLMHVADGAPARWHGPEAGGEEVEQDQAYLDRIKAEFEAQAIPVEAVLAYGDPVKQIIKWVSENKCDLVAMSTHGHQFVADMIYGTTAVKVQHGVSVPVLMLRAR